MLNWTETTGSKPFDTTSIFDMIMAHNSNFNGHDQQVRRQSLLSHELFDHELLARCRFRRYFLMESVSFIGRSRAPADGFRDVIKRERQKKKKETRE